MAVAVHRSTEATAVSKTRDGAPRIDFNKDRKSDVFWYQPATGATSIWFIQGGATPDYRMLDNVPFASGWSYQGVGDFDRNAVADLFWYNASTGHTSAWLMDETGTPTYATYETVPPASGWTLAGFGDFNADDATDIFWLNRRTGETSAWLMDGTNPPTYATYATVSLTGWALQAIGRFDGNGRADLFWHNALTGETAVWFMNGAALPTYATYGRMSALSGWTVQGVGDFDGDRRTDLFWTNNESGQRTVWLMSGPSMTPAAHGKVSAGSGWTLQGFGDFDADGRTDVFWYNRDTGDTAAWLMQGTTHDLVYYRKVPPTSGWVIQAFGDFNGDDRVDPFWYNIQTGETSAWLMNGTYIRRIASYGHVPPEARWIVGGPLSLRLHGIPLSDGDVGYGRVAEVTTAQVAFLVGEANAALALAGLRLTFDPALDWEPLRDTSLNSINNDQSPWWVRPNQLAARHPADVTMLFRHGAVIDKDGNVHPLMPATNAFAYPPDTGAPVPIDAALRTPNANFMAFYNRNDLVTGNTATFVHEFGHYLGLYHTFPGWSDQLGDRSSVAPKIIALIFGGAFGAIMPALLDGDLVADTPPEPGVAYYNAAVSTDTCGGPSAFVIGLTPFAPDRQNIMSYFGACQPPYELSPQQVQRVRAALRHVARSRLLGPRQWAW